ncbi:MAG: helix-turn-helix transcriptional regulator, partial [Myxococcota bacterium]
PPEPAENLASCGQHLALLEEIGCRDLRLRFPASTAPERWVLAEGSLHAPPAGGGYAVWEFVWSHFQPTRKPMEGLDGLLLGTAEDRRLLERPEAVAAVERVLRTDLARSWRLADTAAALGTSPRSLQRALKACAERYSDIVERVRGEEAARLLRHGGLAVTEVGYVCGYADGAHFSRSFKKQYGVTPSAFRLPS